MSEVSKTAPASGGIPPPAATTSSSGRAGPGPAPASRTTSWPALASSRAPSGVAATRNSLSLTSLGIPTITFGSLSWPGCARSVSHPACPPRHPGSPGRLSRRGQKQGHRGLRIAHPAGPRRGGHLVEGPPQQLDPIFGRAFLSGAGPGDEQMDVLVGEARGAGDAPAGLV